MRTDHSESDRRSPIPLPPDLMNGYVNDRSENSISPHRRAFSDGPASRNSASPSLPLRATLPNSPGSISPGTLAVTPRASVDTARTPRSTPPTTSGASSRPSRTLPRTLLTLMALPSIRPVTSPDTTAPSVMLTLTSTLSILSNSPVGTTRSARASSRALARVTDSPSPTRTTFRVPLPGPLSARSVNSARRARGFPSTSMVSVPSGASASRPSTPYGTVPARIAL